MLIDILKGLGRNIIEIIRIRLEILSLDLKEERIRFVSILMLGAFAFLLLSLGIITGLFLLIITLFEIDRLLVIRIFTITLLSSGLILLAHLIWKLRHDPGLFEYTISELDRDYEALGGRRKKSDK